MVQLDRLSMDILGPLPVTSRNNKYILVVTDHFTKWVEVFPVQDQSAITCATIVLNEVISRFGCPYDIHTDQGRNFESEIFSELCKLLEIRKTRTSTANPKCNGQTERFNRTLLHMVKSYLRGQQTRWDEYLGCLAAAYRATPNESTEMTPNMLMLGKEVRQPVEVMYGSSTSEKADVVSYGDYASNLRDKMNKAHEQARKHLAKKNLRQKDYYDAKSTLFQYKVGDYVWYLTSSGQLNTTPKLRHAYEGPFLVFKKLSDLNYVIQMSAKTTSRKVVHHDKLKPYNGTRKLKWAKTALQKGK